MDEIFWRNVKKNVDSGYLARSHGSRLTGENNSVKMFGFISSQRNKCFLCFFAFFFLHSGTNTVDRGHVRRASWDPYAIGHLWRGGSCEGPNAVRFFALRYGGLQGGLVKIKLQSFNRWSVTIRMKAVEQVYSAAGTVNYAVQGGSKTFKSVDDTCGHANAVYFTL